MERQLNFRQIAQKEVSFAEIMTNRTKLDTEDIIDRYPDGFVIDEIEYVTMTKNGKEESFWVFHIAETEFFGFAGTILTKIFERYLELCEGDFEALYNAFKESEGLSVKLEEARTKDGKALIKVEVL